MTQTTTITRQLLRITTAGSVDDGKSTLIGRLLHDTDSLSLDHLEAVTDEEGVADLAALSDGLRAEREQGITIDVAYRFFSTDSRSYILADTPGHERYTRNMFTGASNAHVAILLVDAQLGVLRQTRRGAPQGGEPAGHRLGARSARRGGLAAVVVAPHVGDRACPSAAATRPSSLRRIDSEIIASALDPHSLTIGTNVRDDAALDARLIASIRRYRKVPISQVARSGCSAKPAMDWVLERKQRIENALADRPLEVPQQPGRAHGVLQPITAIRTHSGVQVRDGQRRTLAARQVGLPSIPRLGVRGRGGGDGDRDGNRNLKGALGIARPGCGPHQGHLLRCQIPPHLYAARTDESPCGG